jgi:hypothetical protein
MTPTWGRPPWWRTTPQVAAVEQAALEEEAASRPGRMTTRRRTSHAARTAPTRRARVLQPDAEQQRAGSALVWAAWYGRRGRGARARPLGAVQAARLVLLLVVIRPVLKAASSPGAACSATATCGVVLLHGSRPQVRVFHIAPRPVRHVLLTWIQSAGGRLGWEDLHHGRLIRQRNKNSDQQREKELQRLTAGGGCARSYGRLPNCQSVSDSLQSEMWLTSRTTSMSGSPAAPACTSGTGPGARSCN